MKDWNYLFKGEYYQTEWNKELQWHATYKWYMSNKISKTNWKQRNDKLTELQTKVK